jgi:hypothetical protein
LFDKEGVNLLFVLDETESAFYDASHDKKLSDELSAYFGTTIVAKIEVGAVSSETPKKRLLRLQEERNAEATENLNSDPNINEIKTIFDGVLLKNTIKSID